MKGARGATHCRKEHQKHDACLGSYYERLTVNEGLCDVVPFADCVVS